MADSSNPYDSLHQKSIDASPVRNHRRWMFWAGIILFLGTIALAEIAYEYGVAMPLRRYYGV